MYMPISPCDIARYLLNDSLITSAFSHKYYGYGKQKDKITDKT